MLSEVRTASAAVVLGVGGMHSTHAHTHTHTQTHAHTHTHTHTHTYTHTHTHMHTDTRTDTLRTHLRTSLFHLQRACPPKACAAHHCQVPQGLHEQQGTCMRVMQTRAMQDLPTLSSVVFCVDDVDAAWIKSCILHVCSLPNT